MIKRWFWIIFLLIFPVVLIIYFLLNIELPNQNFLGFLEYLGPEIVPDIVSATLLWLITIGLVYVYKNVINKRLKSYLETLVFRASGKEPFHRENLDISLNKITSSLDNTRLIFIRIGNFNISRQKYRDVVSDIIKSDHIWDYHIHLQSSFSDPERFLHDFFIIQNNQIQELKPLTTIELAQVQRNDFIRAITPKLNPQGIDTSFSDVILQGIVERATGYPMLLDLISDELTFTGITLFYANESHELDKSVLQQVGKDFIESVNLLVQEKLYIGDVPLDPHDPTALNSGTKFLTS